MSFYVKSLNQLFYVGKFKLEIKKIICVIVLLNFCLQIFY